MHWTHFIRSESDREKAGGNISNSSRSNSKTTAVPIVNYTYQRKVVTNGFWLCMALEKPYWIFHIYIFFSSSSSLLLSSLYFCDVCVFLFHVNNKYSDLRASKRFILFNSRLLAHSFAQPSISMFVRRWMRCYRNKRGNFMTFLTWVCELNQINWWQPKQMKQQKWSDMNFAKKQRNSKDFFFISDVLSATSAFMLAEN